MTDIIIPKLCPWCGYSGIGVKIISLKHPGGVRHVKHGLIAGIVKIKDLK